MLMVLQIAMFLEANGEGLALKRLFLTVNWVMHLQSSGCPEVKGPNFTFIGTLIRKSALRDNMFQTVG